MTQLPPLPDGFQLQVPQQSLPPLPDGFQLLGGEPDKYQQAALADLAANKKLGLPSDDGFKRQILNGATFNGAGTILAALDTPAQMLAHGTLSPSEGYNYAKAFQNAQNDASDQNTGVLGKAVGLGAGVVSGSALANKGLTLVKEGQSFLPRLGAMMGDGAAYGGITGFNSGDGLSDRLTKGAEGAGMGAAFGAAIPTAGAILGRPASLVMSHINAYTNPEQGAAVRLAAALENSGKSAQGVQQAMSDAAASGQGNYTLADALGQTGQRAASSVVRAGEGGEGLANFLQQRQAGQSGAVSNILDDALGTNGQTANQASKGLMQQAATDAAPLYKAAEAVKPVWSDRYQQFLDDPITHAGLARGIEIQRLEALAKGEKFDPTDLAVTGFDDNGNVVSKVPNMRSIDAIKKGFDSMLDDYRDSTTGRLVLDQKGRAVDAVRRAFLGEVDQMNPAYATARQAWAGPASIDSAIDLGQNAANRGRSADNIDVFNSLGQPQQQGYRHGYADILAGKIERDAGPSTNSVRRLTSDKAQNELAALSKFQGPDLPGAPNQLAQRLGREQDMFDTYQRAMTGSRTADNLADGEAQKIDPHVIGDLLQGRFMAAGAKAVRGVSNKLTGFTPEVRQAYGNMLMSNGENVSPLLQKITDQAANRQALAAALSRMGATGGGEGSRYLLK